MAGDWIPIRKELHNTPEVLFIHAESGVPIAQVVFALIKMWSWFDSEATDGFVPRISSAISPHLFGETSAFWEIVVHSGWLLDVEKNGEKGLQIPNADRWLGQSAKRRLLDARRKREAYTSAKSPKKLRKISEKTPPTEQNRTGSNKKKAIGKKSSTIPAQFVVTGDMRKWAAESAPSVDVDRETLQFVDHHTAKGSTFKDWVAAWRTWMRNAVIYANGKPNAQSTKPDPIEEMFKSCI